MSKIFDVEKSIEAQKRYCRENGDLIFAPKDGICWRCRRNIYEKHTKETIFLGEIEIITTGIDVEKASTELITGCPHCNKSFVD